MSGEEILRRLNERNDVRVFSVRDPEFATYGRVVESGPCDFSELTGFLERETDIPEKGNIYIASVSGMEKTAAADILMRQVYGGMPIQIGYCNGRNTTYNGFEYHKGSEVNIAATDFMLVLGHIWDIRENTYRAEMAQVFFVERGTAVEMYQTTLHLSPCRVSDAGYMDVVVLPRGTNTPLTGGEEPRADQVAPAGEARLLLQKNKWVIAHPKREQLIRQGAFPGLLGEYKELFY